MTKKQISHRNSVDGRFVNQKYAESHPKTTEREAIKHPERSDNKPKPKGK